MALMTPIRRLFQLEAKARQAPERRAQVSSQTIGGSGLAADVPQWAVDDYRAFEEEGYGRCPLVFACIKQIATSGAQARIYPATTVNGEIEEQLDTPLAQLLKRPQPKKTQYELKELHHTSQQIAGNTYIFKLRGQMAQPIGLRVLPPHRVRVVPGNDGQPKGYLYKLDGVDYPIAAEDLIHIKSANLGNDWYGLSPIHVLARRINMDASLLTLQTAFFRNGGIPAGILKFKRELDEDEPEIFRRQWRQRFGGSKAWDIAVFGDSMDYQQVSIDLDKMMMPDLSAMTEADICMGFQVPPILVGAKIGIDHATYSNYGQAFEAFWYGTIDPEDQRLMDGLQIGLEDDFPGDWSLAKDVSQVRALQEDEDKRAAREISLFHAGLKMQNEARKGVDADAVEGGDFFLIPIGYTTINLDQLQAGIYPADPMDQWKEGELTLNEARVKHGEKPLPGGDIRIISSRGTEQTEDQLASGETPLKPPNITFAITGPTVDSLPESISPMFPPNTIAAPKPPPVMPFGGPPAQGGVTATTQPPTGGELTPPPNTPPALPAAQNRSLVRLEGRAARTPRQRRYAKTLAELRTKHTDAAKEELTGYFKSLASRAAGIIGRNRSLYGAEVRAPAFGADDLVPKAADGQLAAILRRIAAETAQAVWVATNESGLAGDVEWSEKLPSVSKLLTQAAGRAIDINDVTRQQLAQVLTVGQERGYTVGMIADGVLDEGYPGVKSVITETYANRAETIARTETMKAQLGSQIARYAAVDIGEVEAQDGEDDDSCSERNGQTYTLDEAEQEMEDEHPNGTLSFMPVFSGDQSEGDGEDA